MSSTQEHLTPGGRYNVRLGVVLFLICLLIYAIYVGLSAFRGDLMARAVFDGVNFAVVYGFGLIILAFAMAILYTIMCRPMTDENGGPR
jgi:uncharacterized membrane protein (DUF485 family)